jgi:N6-L-threonylcarbamoyladenine synthase
VAANSQLRREAVLRGKDNDVTVVVPPRALCTDNAVMIGMAGLQWWRQGRVSSLSLTAQADAKVELAASALA